MLLKAMRTLALTLLATAALAQQSLPRFEVASVKPPGPKDRFIILFNYPGGMIRITNYTCEQLLEESLRVQRFQISGAPAWTDVDKFVIEAKPPASSELSTFKPSNPEAPLVDVQRQMLLALLIDRFQLKFHRESRESPVYLLRRGRKEPKLEPTKHPNERIFLAGLLGGRNGGSVEGGNATMDFIAWQLSASLRRPVPDRTGLTGAFDFNLDHVYDPQEYDTVAIARRTARELGLKLENSRAPVETIVIDHVEKPAAN